MNKRIIITVGGTGGHIHPACALADELLAADSEIELLFLGGKLDRNPLFDSTRFAYHSLTCGTMSLKTPLNSMMSAAKILRGFLRSRQVIREYNPALMIGFGSYHTVPALLAAKSYRLPFILHEANSIPGRVNRFFSKDALFTGVQFPYAEKALKGLSFEIPLPLRFGYSLKAISRDTANAYFGLSDKKKTLLIFGGSQGAHSINKIIFSALQQLPQNLLESIQLLHFTGDPSIIPQVIDNYQMIKVKSVVKPYESRMEMALRAADVAVARAGAMTIAELVEFEVPSILIPYPHAADNHQEGNADFMVNEIQGAHKLLEQNLNPSSLTHELTLVLATQSQMRQAIQRFKKEQKSKTDLANLVLDHLLKERV